MKTKATYFENIRNKEKFFCKDLSDTRTIDGDEYLRVFRVTTNQDCLVKKDILRKIPKPN